MEHYTLSAENNTLPKSPLQPSINVMGMEVDKDWFTGLLDTLPEAQQRQLSRLLLETINDVFPDLTKELSASDSGGSYGSSATDEPSLEVYRLGDDEYGGDDENEETEDGDELYQQEEDSADDEEGYTSHATDTDEDEEDRNAEAEYGNEPAQAGQTGNKTRHINTSEARGEMGRHQHSVTDHHHTSSQPQSIRNKRNLMGSYLTRFASPRIRQGLTIWEELSVTIPSFMESYVMHFAADAGMLVHPAGGAKGGLVTVHILFHLAQHRRPVCRLLDLVLEAEDGMLKEQDFMPGGAFAIGDEEQQSMTTDEESEIDYDCSDTGNKHQIRPQGRRQYISPRDVAMYSNTNAVTQLVRSGTARRA